MEEAKKKTRLERFKEEFADCKARETNLPDAVFSSLDAAWDGIKPYDFYYHKIYVPIWRATKGKFDNWNEQRKIEKERGKSGVARRDCWSLCDYLLDVLAIGLRTLSDEIYGYNPNWNELPQDPHYDPQLYFKIQVYLETYEKLQEAYLETDKNIYYTIEHSEYTYILQQSCYRQIKRIINDHLEALWD